MAISDEFLIANLRAGSPNHSALAAERIERLRVERDLFAAALKQAVDTRATLCLDSYRDVEKWLNETYIPAMASAAEAMDEQSDVCAEANREHDRLMREDPKYRESYENVDRIWKGALGRDEQNVTETK